MVYIPLPTFHVMSPCTYSADDTLYFRGPQPRICTLDTLDSLLQAPDIPGVPRKLAELGLPVVISEAASWLLLLEVVNSEHSA